MRRLSGGCHSEENENGQSRCGRRPEPPRDPHYCFRAGLAGRQGEQGAAGANGYSPTVVIETAEGGHEIHITDADGEKRFFVRDGSRADAVCLAEYGVTTQAELDEAVSAGKTVLVTGIPMGYIAALARVRAAVPGSGEEDTYIFTAADEDADVFVFCTGGTWYAHRFLQGQLTAPIYDPSAAYAVGDYVYHSCGLYRCVTAIPAGEAWTPAHWMKTDTGTELKDIKEKAGRNTQKGSISFGSNWVETGPGLGIYMQDVTILGAGVTGKSKIDMQPDIMIVAQLMEDGVAALQVINDNGVLTAYAAGAIPTVVQRIQCTITEVDA